MWMWMWMKIGMGMGMGIHIYGNRDGNAEEVEVGEKMKWEPSEVKYTVDFDRLWLVLEVTPEWEFATGELALRVLNYTSFCNK